MALNIAVLQRQLEDMCRSLNMDEATSSAALERLRAFSSDGHLEVLVGTSSMHGLTGGKASNNFVSLSQLLKTANIDMLSFFDHHKEFLSLSQMSEDSLKQLEKAYIVIKLLYDQYRKNYQKLLSYVPLTAGDGSASTRRRQAPPLEELVFQFGWLLFLCAKKSILGEAGSCDILMSFHLLIAVIHVLVVHAPVEARRFSFDAPPFGQPVPADVPAPLSVLHQLCTATGALFAEVAPLYEQVVQFIDSLRNAEQGLAGDSRLPSDSALSDVRYFGGLADGFLVHNVGVLQSQYSKLNIGSDFDESSLLHAQDNTPATPSKTPMTRPTMKKPAITRNLASAFDGLSSPDPVRPPITPGRLVPPMTPMSRTLHGTSWLMSLLESEPSEPNSSLERFFALCNPNPRADVLETVNGSLELIPFPSDEIIKERAGLRKQLCLKLYFRVLTAILLGEEQRLQKSNFSGMLASQNFHKQLLACCVQTVVYVFKISSLAFPAVLEKLNVAPFDFCAMIETFLKFEPTLPRPNVVDHFKNLQSQIVEVFAWQEDSPLWQHLEDAGNRKLVVNSANNAVSTPRRQARSILTPVPASPSANRVATSVSAPTTPLPLTPSRNAYLMALPQTPGNNFVQSLEFSKPAHMYLELFFRKVMFIASKRMHDMCTALQLDALALRQIWSVFTYVLAETPVLLRNRHVDVMVMCSIFAVTRARDLPIQFKNIIGCYRNLPGISTKVYREVDLGDGSVGDIIKFYNGAFISKTREAVLSLRDLSSTPAELPPVPEFPQSPRTKMYGPMAVSISPMRPQYVANTVQPSASPIQMTPRTKALYAFGESPAKDLVSINKQLNLNEKRSFEADSGSDAGNDSKKLRPIQRQLFKLQQQMGTTMGPPPVRSPAGMMTGSLSPPSFLPSVSAGAMLPSSPPPGSVLNSLHSAGSYPLSTSTSSNGSPPSHTDEMES